MAVSRGGEVSAPEGGGVCVSAPGVCVCLLLGGVCVSALGGCVCLLLGVSALGGVCSGGVSALGGVCLLQHFQMRNMISLCSNSSLSNNNSTDASLFITESLWLAKEIVDVAGCHGRNVDDILLPCQNSSKMKGKVELTLNQSESWWKFKHIYLCLIDVNQKV